MRVGANSSSTGVTARTSLGVAHFIAVDGSEVEFKWVQLDEQQLDELRNALEEVLPGRWRSPETLHQSV